MNDQVNIIELSEASSLAKVISSKTSQEIITFIGENEGCSASNIKTALSLPASTIHYNLKALIDSKIIDDSNFTYSSKGKEIVHYSLTNKILIIVPKKQKISSQLKAFIPGLAVVGGIIAVSLISKIFNSSSSLMSAGASNTRVFDSAIKSGSDMLPVVLNEASPMLTKEGASMADFTSQAVTSSVPWYSSKEFFIGLIVASLVFIGSYFLFKFIQKKKKTISK